MDTRQPNPATAPRQTRVLICDQSAFVRRMMSQLIETDSALIVVDSARDAADLIEKSARLVPDVIVLSPRPPDLGVRNIRRQLQTHFERTPVILACCPPTSAGGHAALCALTEGAADVLALDHDCLSARLSDLRIDLIRKVKAVSGAKAPARPRDDAAPSLLVDKRIDLIIIGAAAGGPPVLERILSQLPPQLPCAIVIAQRFPAQFIKPLAERLDGASAISVVHGEHGMPLHAGSAYIIPGGLHGRIRTLGGGPGPIRLDLAPDAQAEAHLPSIDELFLSAARQCARHTLAIVLSGSGDDGRIGAADLAHAGGVIIAQDQASSLLDSMPSAAAESGASRLGPDTIAATIAALASRSARRAA